jgi:hypothetical protein
MARRYALHCLLLAALLLLYVVLATWYSLVIPLGEAPDEVDHYRVIRYLAHWHRWPITEEEHEAVQPPLYYLVGTALTFWIRDHVPFATLANADFDLADPLAPRNLLLHPAYEGWPFEGWALAWHMVRLVSVALGSVTVWAVFRLGRTLFPARPDVGLAMAALTAFTPQFLFMTAVVSNDNAATAMSALILWRVAELLRRGSLKAPQLALLGLLVGLGLLSKSNLIALLPVVGLAIVAAWWRQRERRPGDLLHALLLVFGLAGLVSAWYYVRNLVVFGDPLGFSFVMSTNPLRQGPLSSDVLVWLFRGLSRSFWLGWIGIELDEGLYWVIHGLCLASGLGFGAWLVLRWRRIAVHVRITVALLGLYGVLILTSLISWTARVGGTDQGRLVFPILPAVTLVLAAGLLIWLPRRSGRLGAGTLAASWLILALIAPGRYLAPVHAPPAPVDALPSSATALDVRFGESIRLAGYQMEEVRVRPGEKLSLNLYWQTDAVVEENFWLLIELVDANGTFLMYKDGSPSAGRDTTDRWAPGSLVASQHRLSIPDYGQPGTYWLTLRMHPSGERVWLPIYDPAGSSKGDILTLNDPVEITVQ